MSKTDELFRHFVFNPEDYAQKMIVEPYNKATGKAVFLTNQQKEGFRAIKSLVTAKLKYSFKQEMTEEEKGICKKIGISIMSGKGNGKDAFAAMCIIWFMDCFPYPKVPCTSVSADQLGKVLWSEISKWLSNSHAKDRFVLQNDKMYRSDIAKEVVGKRWFAFPKTANPKGSIEEQVETLAGLHEDHMMIVVDEGSGIPAPVFDPLEGTLTGMLNFILLLFNPTRTIGYAIDTQYKNSEYWITLIWNSEESEIADKQNIERIKKIYAYDLGIEPMQSNPCRIRIFGLPPISDENTLIPADWIEDAILRENEILEEAPLLKALDVGGGGDDSVIATMKSYKLFPFKKHSSPDPQELINWAGIDIDTYRPDNFAVDVIGLGWAVAPALADKKGTVVECVDSRTKADNPERFFNKRAENAYRVRDAFAKKLLDIPDDEEFKMELLVLRTEDDGKGRIKLIDKRKMRKELQGKSTNKFDAVAMLFNRDPSMISKNLGRNVKPPRLEHPNSTSNSWMGG